ncbi:GNAT family N-acetyltransferase [Vibrio mediterranei]|jgi:GNAT superfamily N-acetyltransferase
MEIYPEIELSEQQHKDIEALRNDSFPEHKVPRSYFKQLPHMRALEYVGDDLIGYLGIDYRVISVGGSAIKVLGVIDFCVSSNSRGKGVGSSMLNELAVYASTKDVDFIVLVSELDSFYTSNGFACIEATHSWLRLHEHNNYGVAEETVEEFYFKPVGTKMWPTGDVDWLGYMF